MRASTVVSVGLVSILCTAMFTGCGTPTAPTSNSDIGIVIRKIASDSLDNENEIWVKYESADLEKVVSYDVNKDYFDRIEPGDAFDSKYAISSGTTEYEFDR